MLSTVEIIVALVLAIVIGAIFLPPPNLDDDDYLA